MISLHSSWSRDNPSFSFKHLPKSLTDFERFLSDSWICYLMLSRDFVCSFDYGWIFDISSLVWVSDFDEVSCCFLIEPTSSSMFWWTSFISITFVSNNLLSNAWKVLVHFSSKIVWTPSRWLLISRNFGVDFFNFWCYYSTNFISKVMASLLITTSQIDWKWPLSYWY